MASSSYVPLGVSIQSSPYLDPLGIFGPLGKNYCLIFYVFSAFFFFWFLVSVIGIVREIFAKQKNLFLMIVLAVYNFIFYLQQRALYNMCIRSVA